MNKIELLAPAGDLARAKIALDFGADAVYLGAKAYSLRARASNFDFEEIKKICEYAHSLNKKVYIVTNIICHNAYLNGYHDFLDKLMHYASPDGLICADPYIITYSKKAYPQLEIHVSTQQSITNSAAARFYKSCGASRIVLAREVSFDELKLLMKNLHNEIELEYFVHGAVCIAYSGRCMMSNHFSLRDANIGGCAQSCRWVYELFDDQQIYTNKFSMSAKDMSLLNHLDQLLSTDLKSLKIEGRMKSEYYLACIIHSYRNAIDDFYNNKKIDFKQYQKELTAAANRLTDNAWFDHQATSKKMLYHEQPSLVSQVFAFRIINDNLDGSYMIESRNYFDKKMHFEVISPHQPITNLLIKTIYDLNNNELEAVHTPMRKYKIVFIQPHANLKVGDIVRIDEYN